MSNFPASSPAVSSPPRSASRMSRRVGLASAPNTSSSGPLLRRRGKSDSSALQNEAVAIRVGERGLPTPGHVVRPVNDHPGLLQARDVGVEVGAAKQGALLSASAHAGERL